MPDRTRTEQLQAILDKGDEKACLKFFAKVTEAQRREVAKTAIAVFKQSLKLVPSGKNTWGRDPRLPAAQIAVLSACSLSELKALGWQSHPDAKMTFQLLESRRPEWLPQYAECLLEQSAFTWPLVRALVRRGLCPRPQHENYTLGMIRTLDSWSGDYHHVDPYKPSLIANLRADKELLQTEIWELFRIEGQGDLSLASHDKYLQLRETNTKYCWNLVLKELSRTGEISRDRLLDESLAALNRGFAQFRVAWFSQFHELLEPTVEERLARQDAYLVLLASPIPPSVTFALDALEIIDSERPLPAAATIDALQPVLLARHKGTAKRAVQWLHKLADREPKCNPEAASAAAQALAHEAAEVQKAAIDVLEKHGSAADAGLRKQVAQAASGVAASLRKRLQTWQSSGGAAAEPAKKDKARPAAATSLADLEKQAAALADRWVRLAGIRPMLAAAKEGRIEIAALDFGPLDAPRLDPAAQLRPVADIDEWIDVCAHFLESPEEIDEGERVLEGLS
ncbi:MAG TPA: DUF6493 family protein, partial [Pirellulaceae bacterium]|nr:DUF6493 family protein [Pirellulaceae bacterium]